tara:strand:+ start:507 stop:1418 length:912 start_codon:yes stop_codon:yes gene_type:complete
MLWTEKYRPSKLTEIRGQTNFTTDAYNWIEENNMPNLLIYGQYGTGKTAASIVLAKSILKDDFKNNYIEINASDDRKLETVRTTIKNVAQSMTLGDAPFRIIHLDEMDGMTSDAQNALKRIMERYADNVRFIITCNDRNKIIFALQSRCANYNFKPVSNESMLEVVKDILSKERVTTFQEEDLKEFIYSMNGDLRRAITELQAAKSSKTTLKKQVESGLEEYQKILIKITDKNSNTIIDMHNLIYEGRSMKEICNGLHDVVLGSTGLDTAQKFKLLRVIGEAEWRSSTMTPKILASWMVGQLL